MTQFDTFHVFVENSVNSDLCFFCEFYSNQPKSETYSKMPMFEQLKKQVPVHFSKDAILASVQSIFTEVLD